MKHLQRGAELIGVAIFATMFGAFLLQIFMRYLVNRPLAWTEEVSLIAYLWSVFWACAFVVRDQDHVRFDLVYQALGERHKRMFALAGAALVGGLFAAALPSTYDYISFMARERTWVIGIRFDLVFACFGLFVVAVAVRAARDLARLLGRDWRQHL
ncbi:MAG: TRAP transporter small permease [Pseudomonadota bacterium]